MDDYLIATSSSIDLHRQATHDLLDLIEQHDLFIKPEKCVWEAPHVDYLGLILEKGVVRMDPAKIAGVAEWPIPTYHGQTSPIIFGLCQLLPALRPKIFPCHQTPKQTNKKRGPIPMGTKGTIRL